MVVRKAGAVVTRTVTAALDAVVLSATGLLVAAGLILHVWVRLGDVTS